MLTKSPEFTIPIAAPTSTSLQSVHQNMRARIRNRPLILVADDELVTRKLLVHQLNRCDYDTVEASDGSEVLRLLERQIPDLILLDFSMPKCDGLKALRFIRQQYDASKLPVIMMTSSGGRTQIVEAFENGANDYFAKPVDQPVAMARIRSQLVVRKMQLALRESEERYAIASLGTNDGLWDWNLLSGELYLSPRWRSMLGRPESVWNPKGAEWMELIHPEDRNRIAGDLENHLLGHTNHFEGELRMQGGDGQYRWMLCRGMAVRDETGCACRIAGSLTDITEGKVADALTGLPNRILFRERVQRSIEKQKRRASCSFAVLYLDIDDFKLINDSFGHDAGDTFLVDVAKRIEAALRDSETVFARLGGDEFAILLEDLRGKTVPTEVASRIFDRLKVPFQIGDREILAHASIGIAISRHDLVDADEIIAEADTAMYQAKKQAIHECCVYNTEMAQQKSIRLELGSELANAIQRDELSIHFQPIICVSTWRTAGFEALMRWNHPEHGMIPPVKFIPIAESTGLIVELGGWILKHACLQAAIWNKKYNSQISISVNVSMRQLSSLGFVDSVKEVLKSTGLAPHLLKLEVTESLLMQSPDETINLLHQLRTTGASIGIDDFGTGYSSLSYLHQMPLNVLKIDRSFVSKMTESEKHLAIVRTILGLAESLGLQVVAEGVETKQQAKILADLKCNFIQGYLYSKPVDSKAAENLIREDWSNR